MQINYIIPVVAALIAGLISYFGDFFEKKKIFKALVIALLTGIGILVGLYWDHQDSIDSRPTISTTTNLKGDIFSVDIISYNFSLNSAVLSFHLPYHVLNLEKLHREADAKSVVYIEGEQDSYFITNRVEIRIEDIIPNKKITFKMNVRKIDSHVGYVDSDVYYLSYIWSHKGERLYGSEWRSLNNDTKVKPPIAQLSAIRWSNEPGSKFDMRFNFMLLSEGAKDLKDGDSADIIWVKDRNYSSEIIENFGPLKRKQY